MPNPFKASWICPRCHELLEPREGSLVCAGGHVYDRAREGYVNFLVGRQRSGERGDTAEMLKARRRFLERGFYEPLRERLAAIIEGLNNKVIVETGCGEGYYIGGISEQISSSKCLASDISKEAVRMASNRYKDVAFAVADTNQFLPLAEGSVDVVLDIFAPRNASEFRRVLRPGGRLLVVVPAGQHLAELRGLVSLLTVQPEKRRAVEQTLTGEFELTAAETMTVPLRLDGIAAGDLVAMMPSARFLGPEDKEKLAAVTEFEATAHFQILTFR